MAIPRTLLILLLLLPATFAGADLAGQPAAEQVLARYMAALQRHDLRTLEALIRQGAPFEVIWLDSTPPKKFSLHRDDYLHQVKATWHFGSNEKLSMGKVSWHPGPNGHTLLARFRLEENRIILGNATGQSSDLELVLGPDQGQVRITAIRARTRMW